MERVRCPAVDYRTVRQGHWRAEGQGDSKFVCYFGAEGSNNISAECGDDFEGQSATEFLQAEASFNVFEKFINDY